MLPEIRRREPPAALAATAAHRGAIPLREPARVLADLAYRAGTVPFLPDPPPPRPSPQMTFEDGPGNRLVPAHEALFPMGGTTGSLDASIQSHTACMLQRSFRSMLGNGATGKSLDRTRRRIVVTEHRNRSARSPIRRTCGSSAAIDAREPQPPAHDTPPQATSKRGAATARIRRRRENLTFRLVSTISCLGVCIGSSH